jgi:hypothetical protein
MASPMDTASLSGLAEPQLTFRAAFVGVLV